MTGGPADRTKLGLPIRAVMMQDDRSRIDPIRVAPREERNPRENRGPKGKSHSTTSSWMPPSRRPRRTMVRMTMKWKPRSQNANRSRTPIPQPNQAASRQEAGVHAVVHGDPGVIEATRKNEPSGSWSQAASTKMTFSNRWKSHRRPLTAKIPRTAKVKSRMRMDNGHAVAVVAADPESRSIPMPANLVNGTRIRLLLATVNRPPSRASRPVKTTTIWTMKMISIVN